jgi:hypothetical protein
MGRIWAALGAMVVLWLVAIAFTWSGFLSGLPLAIALSAAAWVGLASLVAVLGWLGGGRWWLGVGGAVITVLLAVPLDNWSVFAPGAYFEMRRPLFDRAVRTTELDDTYYGAKLPLALRTLSADGRVSRQGDLLFFPQWLGIPDDAGGYFYGEGSPAGVDMYGMTCVDPVDLGDDWWMCGM